MNRILYASDCLKILQDRDALPDESVDLIYLDPPFNSNSQYNLPFKGKYKSAVAAKAFDDTWRWTIQNTEQLEELDADPRTRSLATIIRFAQSVDSGLGAYLINMAIRLAAMRRVLKTTGSIYLHCDPTASHYLKLVMDHIYGRKNFRNDITWKRFNFHSDANHFGRVADNLLFYSKSDKHVFATQRVPYSKEYIDSKFTYYDEDGRRFSLDNLNPPGGRGPVYEFYGVTKPWRFKETTMRELDAQGRIYTDSTVPRLKRYLDELPGQAVHSVWTDIPPINSQAKERLGYPTQKPLALMERIIQASCPPVGIVLDPFCGCGTTLHAAETLGRKWIGIDISSFATGLVRDRIVKAFAQLDKADIAIRGEIPVDVESARFLAHRDKFEFEKWVCGHIGAEGMFHDPGTPGADGGVDGVMKFFPVRPDQKWKAEFAIVQVKSGQVSPDAVRALRETVDRFDVRAGVMVCFDQYMTTVENQRSKETFTDALGTYPVIQGYSVENLLADAPLNLPLYGFKRQGALLTA